MKTSNNHLVSRLSVGKYLSTLVQDKNPVTQVLRNAKPGLQGFCPVLNLSTSKPKTQNAVVPTSRAPQHFGSWVYLRSPT